MQGHRCRDERRCEVNTSSLTSQSLNRKERRAQRLLQHYATCERLALYLIRKNLLVVPSMPDGKRISVALFKAERGASLAAERYCNGEIDEKGYGIHQDAAFTNVQQALGVLPPGFFVNSDPRGYALKIDGDNAQGKALIDAVGLPTDMGGYGLLSPEINGDR